MATPRLPFLYPFLLRPSTPGKYRVLPDNVVALAPARPQKRAASTFVEAVESTVPARIPPLAGVQKAATDSQRAPHGSTATRSRPTAAGSKTAPAINSRTVSTISNSSSAVTSRTPSISPPRTANPTLRSRAQPDAGFQTSVRRRRPTSVAQRYGTANEPPPHLGPGKLLQFQETKPGQRRLPEPSSPPKTTPQTVSSPPQQPPSSAQQAPPTTPPTSPNVPNVKDTLSKIKATAEQSALAKAAEGKAAVATSGPTASAKNESALATILRMDAEGGAEKPPHLQAPLYVHHFDTFTLVRQLQEGGFSEDQAVTMMKLMRLVLADNMELANQGIVSKGDAEMSAYLFRAACSELRTEIRNNRQTNSERTRSERTSLQHEVDILAQRISQDISSLKDELKGMFDDRKMSVRIERRDVENRIQELNYRITTRLNSEMRSEVEGLRWVLVRRTAIALVSVVVMALWALRANRVKEAKMEKERVRAEKDAAAGGFHGDGGATAAAAAAAGGTMGVDAAKGSVAKGMAAGDDVNPELVSLG